MQVGSEFFHLCHEQLNLLAHGLGASLVIVSLTEKPTRGTNTDNLVFMPVATYPEGLGNIDPQALMMWLAEVWGPDAAAAAADVYGEHPDPATGAAAVPLTVPQPSRQVAGWGESQNEQDDRDGLDGDDRRFQEQALNGAAWRGQGANRGIADVQSDWPLDPDPPVDVGGAIEYRSPLALYQEPMVLPLVYQGMMMGMLVTARMDREWNQLEKYEIGRVAQTLATACVLDQRSQWLEQRVHQQAMTYAQLQDHQQDRLDDILHQFRNPLTALRTFGKLLIKRLQLADRNRSVAESIVRESDRLQELLIQLSETVAMATPPLPGSLPSAPSPSDPSPSIVDMADGSDGANPTLPTVTKGMVPPLPASTVPLQQTVKALTGQALQIAPYSIMDILVPLMTSAYAIAQERQISLQMATVDHLVPVQVDAKALREVLNNLLDNALKYTPAGGQVLVIPGIEGEVGSAGQNHQGLAIADTGPGIPLEDQPHLFQRHFRGVQAESDIPGTGLGLAIAQMIMAQMHGTIEVFSPASTCPLPLPSPLVFLPLDGSPPSSLPPELPPELPPDHQSTLIIDSPFSFTPDLSPGMVAPQGLDWAKNPGTIFMVWMVSVGEGYGGEPSP